MAKKVLIVDDEKDIVDLITYNLKKEGFAADSAPDGETALAKIKKGNYDLVILDLMLPGLQGIELCRIIRNDPATSSLPVIMLTAKGGEVDKVLGLEMGADDYITKPFSPRELVARVNAVLRRVEERPASARIIKEGGLVIDKDAYAVTRKGIPLKLSATEFRLLLYLVERKGRVFNREQLLNAVWSDEAFVEPRTVDVHIRRLRAQIEENPSSPRYIKTMRGAGYFFDGKQ
ncbi:MAG: DNA-binding response regulator [Nitrospirae bacterium GWF2_44_13]|nr:MAG: DNA-binding response regulator [Nitrospirae bacterium GWF2_44_13]OGW66301.1 MAG: DNA-binding response regulator [Nitrospirae bacterium RIFOXYA2_FULL_44_9]HBG93380.1 DNA-binding response regulator [Nitrospiraceae bacterium]